MVPVKPTGFHDTQNPWRLISGSTIKVIALILMVMDHLHQMFYTQGIPDWFNWFGRPVATLFLFLCAEGFYHTRNKKGYMLRLLIGSCLMTVLSRVLSSCMPLESVALINNMFGTLFMATVYMALVDRLRTSSTKRQTGSILLVLGGMLLPVLVGLGLVVILSKAILPYWLIAVLFMIPNPIIVEGGFVLVLMGVLFYVLQRFRIAQIGLVVLVSVFAALTTGDAQWLMGTAVVPIWLYNGQRGRGSKYFFYIFYPAHIYLFYSIAWLIQ
ncbi:MAG: conjugal transfer protein TraX [Treponema sp.]|jgi:hypothetical protein|nr:conjugal transfer protein TraX [Treponema sp.]